jgi:hypothetical protein
MEKARKAEAAKPRKGRSVQTHDITVEVGSSIVIDPTGQRLYVKEIKGGRITFEQDEPPRARRA